MDLYLGLLSERGRLQEDVKRLRGDLMCMIMSEPCSTSISGTR